MKNCIFDLKEKKFENVFTMLVNDKRFSHDWKIVNKVRIDTFKFNRYTVKCVTNLMQKRYTIVEFAK